MTTRRRALVLTAEAARHPFRRTLPPHVFKPIADAPARREWWRITGRDWRDFFTAYCASFVAVAVFIS
jgi:hypothetical protein